MRFIGRFATTTVLLLLVWRGDSVALPLPDDDSAEAALWQAMQNSKQPADFQSFLLLYPRGRFAGLARIRLTKLGGAPSQAASERRAEAVPDQAAAPDRGPPQLYRLDVTPNVAGMGQTVTVKCRGFMPPALFDRIVVVPVGAPDFDAAGKIDEGRLLWSGLANLYDCGGAGIDLPMMLKGAYEVRYLSRQYSPEGALEVTARSGFVYR